MEIIDPRGRVRDLIAGCISGGKLWLFPGGALKIGECGEWGQTNAVHVLGIGRDAVAGANQKIEDEVQWFAEAAVCLGHG